MEIIRLKDEENARLKAHIVLLEQKIDLLVRRIFGARSEKLNAAQLELLLSLGDEPVPKPEASGAELEAAPQSQEHCASRRERPERQQHAGGEQRRRPQHQPAQWFHRSSPHEERSRC